jgi:putative chitinase
MINLYSNGGFFWWMGVVEDRNDPLFLGRCRVRIMGYHNQSKQELPTNDLPWAYPLQPITSAAMTGIGSTPVGPVEGTTVMGFFRDGDDCQEPVMMGTVGGIPQDEYYRSLPSDAGFTDPNKKYPLQELRNEPDTNRLARAQGLTETPVGKKKDVREIKVPIANSTETWDQPTIPYAAKYPFNHVTSSESGHVVEIDDTPGAERIQVYHKKGSFVEIDANGTMVRRIVGDDFQIIERNGHVIIKGGLTLTVMGDAKILVQNDCNLEVQGGLTAKVHKDMELNVAGSLKIAAGDAIEMKSKKVNIQGDDINVKATKTFSMSAGTALNIKAGAALLLYGTATAVLNSGGSAVINGLGLSLMPGIAPIAAEASDASVPDATKKMNPRAVKLSDLGFTMSAEDRQAAQAEKLAAEENPSPSSQEYVALKQLELDSGEKLSVASNESIEDIIPQTDCPIGMAIIEAAKKDIGILETGTRSRDGDGLNYGGQAGGGELPKGVFGRIDTMMKSAGLDNPAQVKATGSGYYWCMGAVIDWWSQAGIQAPRIAKVSDFATWARANGLYSDAPCPGAAVLYGPAGKECHTGIVVTVDDDEYLTTIEGNTSGGGYNSNGCGCFLKKAKRARISGYVLPPGCKPTAPAVPPTISDDMTVAIENLKGIVPQKVLDELPLVIAKFDINTPLRLAHFIAQCQHESINFTATKENLNYSESALKAVFGKYFPGQLASEYARQPEKIGNRVYGSRMGNGNEASGEGYKYRGRGYIQLTGKDNYIAFGKLVSDDVVANPDLVATKYPLLSAAWFWVKAKNINPKADLGSDVATITTVTKAVNGGTNGLAERIENFNDVYGRLA